MLHTWSVKEQNTFSSLQKHQHSRNVQLHKRYGQATVTFRSSSEGGTMTKATFMKVSALTLGGVAAAAILSLVSQPMSATAAKISADCNNTLSDAATINAAISNSNPGDTIVISGPCLINAPIVLIGDRTYTSDDRSTILKQADNANLPALIESDSYASNSTFTGDPVIIENITLDGNKSMNTTQPTDGLVLRSWQTIVTNMQIENFHGNGIHLTNLSANGTALANTQVNGRISNVYVSGSDRYGIYVQDSGNSVTDWNMTENWIANSGMDGIHMDNAAGWVIERNHLYGDQLNGIYASRLYATSLSDNYIEDFGTTSTIGTYYGIAGTVQGDTASTITNNRVFQLGTETSGSIYRFIGLPQVNYGTGVVAVTGNTIRGTSRTADTGFYYSKGGGTGLTITSTGNNVTNVGTQRTVGNGVTVSAGI
jgi:Right handed beta helix region